MDTTIYNKLPEENNNTKKEINNIFNFILFKKTTSENQET